MRTTALLLASVLLAAVCMGCRGACAPQRSTVVQVAGSCCPARAPVIWNGHTCVQARECGCYTCLGDDCSDAYPDLPSCARAHDGCGK